MAGYYRCPNGHGRFPIAHVYKGVDPYELFKLFDEHDALPCPKCHADSPKCVKKKEHE